MFSRVLRTSASTATRFTRHNAGVRQFSKSKKKKAKNKWITKQIKLEKQFHIHPSRVSAGYYTNRLVKTFLQKDKNKLVKSFLRNEHGKFTTRIIKNQYREHNQYRGSVFYHDCLEYLSHKILKHRHIKAQVKVRFPLYKSSSKKMKPYRPKSSSKNQMTRVTSFILIGSGIVTICVVIYVCNKVRDWIDESVRNLFSELNTYFYNLSARINGTN